jgi:protein-L-isoaspartate(D-aspartate) O-methyltransferase
VEVRVADGALGAPERAPFEAIAVAAATPVVPRALYDQLALGGRLVLPLGASRGQLLTRVVRTNEGPEQTALIGCRFVPLVDG